MTEQSSPFLLEASWEVCNKVGGIHTVITSKLHQVQADFPDRYLAIGPYLSANSSEFKEENPPAFLTALVQDLAAQGIVAHYGLWKPYNQPTILLDWNGILPTLNELKTSLWERFQLDTLGTSYYDFDQPLLWATAVGRLVNGFAKTKVSIILQLHEWLSAGALLVIEPEIRSVFTTHATVLGRALSSQGKDLQSYGTKIDTAALATQIGVTAKHQLEVLAAKLATVFTTVSHLTAEEATFFLGRTPDLVTENGLDADQFPTFDLLSVNRFQSRNLIESFLAAYFFPSYSFNLKDCFLQFTMGRPEIFNKGFDLYLESLSRVNAELQARKSDQTVISFILVPGAQARLRPSVSGQLTLYRHIQEKIQDLETAQRAELFQRLCRDGENLQNPELAPVAREELVAISNHLMRPTEPPLCPYDLVNPEQDTILNLCARFGLRNRAEDRVKVIYLPVYLDGFDGIFNQPLYSLISAFDLGVFPSRYEPWGYTPMETLGLGVPAITSTLAGFGRSLMKGKKAPTGAYVLDRQNHEADALPLLTQQLLSFLKDNQSERVERRISAYQTAQIYSWKNLYSTYHQAYFS